MRGSIRPFKLTDLMRPYALTLTNEIAQIWDEHVGVDPFRRDHVLLEGLGTWLSQEAWSDDSGYFISIRMHPLYCHSADTQAKAGAVIDAFLRLFSNGKVVHRENEEILKMDLTNINWQEKEKLGLTKTITFVVQTDSYSIGD